MLFSRVLTPVVKSIIQECLQNNRRKVSMGMRKQRMLKRDIWEYVLGKGYCPAYSTVCQYIYKLEHAPAKKEKCHQKPLKKYHYFQDFSDAKNCSKSAIYKNKTVVLVSKYLKITENL